MFRFKTKPAKCKDSTSSSYNIETACPIAITTCPMEQTGLNKKSFIFLSVALNSALLKAYKSCLLRCVGCTTTSATLKFALTSP
eukprot:1089361-Amphidinium_carterae.1